MGPRWAVWSLGVIIVDTGVLVALLSVTDRHHSQCVRWYDQARDLLLVPTPVLAEAAYLVERDCGPQIEAEFVRSFGPVGPFRLAHVYAEDMPRIAELVEQYADLRLGTVDAAVVGVAERLEANQLATVDRRHFSVVRPRHVTAFTLLPERL